MKTNHPTTTVKEIRDAVAKTIRDAVPSLREVLSLPYRELEPMEDREYGQAPTVTVLGRAVDEVTQVRGFKNREVMLLVFLECRIDSTSLAEIEALIATTEHLMTLCSNERGWLRNNSMSDETQTPYLFHYLRQHGLFQSIFAPVYFQVKDRRIF